MYGDPGFVYHAAAARLLGLFAMRLASPEVVPLRYGSYADALRELLDDLERQAIRRQREAMIPDEEETAVMRADFEPVRRALDQLSRAGGNLDATVEQVVAAQDREAADVLSRELIQIERSFLSTEGLPNRPWFRNLIYAPGLTTGYASWPFPEIAEAVENGDQELFDRGVGRVVERLQEASRQMDSVAAAVSGN